MIGRALERYSATRIGLTCLGVSVGAQLLAWGAQVSSAQPVLVGDLLSLPALLVLFGLLLALLVRLIRLDAEGWRRTGVKTYVGLACVLIPVVAGSGLPDPMTVHGQRVMRESQPVIAAIERYEARTGRSPASLADLQPSELTALPRIAADSSFRYSRRPRSTSGRWQVEYRFPGLFDDDEFFVYRPDRDYSDVMSGYAHAERVGDWIRHSTSSD